VGSIKYRSDDIDTLSPPAPSSRLKPVSLLAHDVCTSPSPVALYRYASAICRRRVDVTAHRMENGVLSHRLAFSTNPQVTMSIGCNESTWASVFRRNDRPEARHMEASRGNIDCRALPGNARYALPDKCLRAPLSPAFNYGAGPSLPVSGERVRALSPAFGGRLASWRQTCLAYIVGGCSPSAPLIYIPVLTG